MARVVCFNPPVFRAEHPIKAMTPGGIKTEIKGLSREDLISMLTKIINQKKLSEDLVRNRIWESNGVGVDRDWLSRAKAAIRIMKVQLVVIQERLHELKGERAHEAWNKELKRVSSFEVRFYHAAKAVLPGDLFRKINDAAEIVDATKIVERTHGTRPTQEAN